MAVDTTEAAAVAEAARQAMGGIGVSLARKEDARFIHGQGHYVDDVVLPRVGLAVHQVSCARRRSGIGQCSRPIFAIRWRSSIGDEQHLRQTVSSRSMRRSNGAAPELHIR